MDFVQAQHGYFDGRNGRRWIVIHSMEYPRRSGAARWCANYFKGPNAPRKSAHYCLDDGEIIQTMREADGAWHTPGFAAGLEVNRHSIGIEHAGYARQTAAQWLSGSELERSAALAADIALRNSIPVRRLTVAQIRAGEPGIAGHVDFTHATGSGDHVDPGPDFPWDTYLSRVNAHQSGEVSPGLPDGGPSPLKILLVAGIAGIGVWALMNPAQAQRAARRILPF